MTKRHIPRIAAVPDDAPPPVRMLDDLPIDSNHNTRLIISRESEEFFTISNGDIRMVIRVVELRGNRARLAIEAPANWLILRSELEPQR